MPSESASGTPKFCAIVKMRKIHLPNLSTLLFLCVFPFLLLLSFFPFLLLCQYSIRCAPCTTSTNSTHCIFLFLLFLLRLPFFFSFLHRVLLFFHFPLFLLSSLHQNVPPWMFPLKVLWVPFPRCFLQRFSGLLLAVSFFLFDFSQRSFRFCSICCHISFRSSTQSPGVIL